MFICPDCFSNQGLRRRIVALRPSQPKHRCNFHPTKKGVALAAISPIISEVIANTYVHSEVNPLTGEPNGESLVDVICDVTGANDHEVAEALENLLIEQEDCWPPDGDEPFFSDILAYNRTNEIHEEHSFRWEQFCRDIVYGKRFFSPSAQKVLSEIFDGLHLLRDSAGRPVIYPLEPDDRSIDIFRARIANDFALRKRITDDLASELGPPPPPLRKPGRMHPAGIRAFYGALDIQTCVAELRPTVGETVVSARFRPLRPLLVLDTTRFDRRPKDVNVFARAYLKRLRLWTFMRRFMNEIAQPHLPGSEHLEYVPTQAVAEYLVHHHRFSYRHDRETTIDAIIFRSAQRPEGKNISIFGDACVVENTKQPSRMADEVFDFRTMKPGLQVIPDSKREHYVNSIIHETQSISYDFAHEEF